MPVRTSIAVCTALLADLALATSFETYEIDLPEAQAQYVFAGQFLADDAIDLAVVSVDMDDQRFLNIYAQTQDGWALEHATQIAPDVIFFDKARLSDRDRLLAYRRGEVLTVNAADGTMQPLIRADSIWNVPPFLQMPTPKIARDVTGDGLDDLVVPDFDGLQIWRQRADGSLGSREHLPVHSTLGGAPTDLSLDFNHDDRTDLAFWERGRFRVHLADDERFRTDPIEVDFGNLGLRPDPSFSTAEEDQSNLEARMLWAIADYNGDGIDDLTAYSLKSESLFNKSTTYDIHYGRANARSTEYIFEPDTSVNSGGLQYAADHSDLDGDGAYDLVIFSVEIGIGKIIGALITGSVGVDLLIYSMDNGVYPTKPQFKRKVDVEFSLSTGEVFVPNVIAADFTGDGTKDLLLQSARESFDIYPGVSDGSIFQRKRQRFDIALPSETEGTVEVGDYDADGRADLLVRFERRDDRRVMLMLSRVGSSTPPR